MSEQQAKTKADFAVGDKVTWCKTTETAGGGFRFSERSGTITVLYPAMAVVKMRNGKTIDLFYERLTKEGQKNEVARIFEAITGATVGRDRVESVDLAPKKEGA